ncbi:MAG: DUF975 family protein [Lachnospiraceae bacterium]|nr:DUF975 family protein [Lachnospiraceae bacterium]
MKQNYSIAQLKDTAKEKLTGKYGSAALMEIFQNTLFISALLIFNTFLSLFTLGFAASDGSVGTVIGFVIPYLANFCSSVLAGVMNTGIALFFLNAACGRTCATVNLLYGYQYLFQKSVTLSAVTVLINSICLLPYDIFTYQFQLTGSSQTAIAMVASLLIGMVIYTPISLALSQTYFLLLDFPSYSAKEILQLSIRIMKGRKKQLFVLQLSFLPIMLLGALTLGIGNLWINPYMMMTMALYFLHIMKPAENDTTN